MAIELGKGNVIENGSNTSYIFNETQSVYVEMYDRAGNLSIVKFCVKV